MAKKQKLLPYHIVYADTHTRLEEGINTASARGYAFKQLLQPRSDLFMAVMELRVSATLPDAEDEGDPGEEKPREENPLNEKPASEARVRTPIDLTPDGHEAKPAV